ncbi:MAG: MFS transporter, partial [Desulfatibacillaceae bacterium]|nr:MFS transporter [Desulfatibacillaceae bacterium]
MEKKIDRKIFAALFFAIFTAITGVGIVVPLLPVYAEELGASGFVIGLIFGSFSLSRALFLPYFGKKSDELGRKPFIAAGLALYVVTSVAFMGAAAFSSVWGMIAIRFFQGFASAMILPVVFAYVGDMSPSGREGFVMGIFNISMYASLSLGPVLGGFVKDAFGMQAAFACMLALSLAACV